MKKLKWWGYIHVNGSVHVKRFFNPDDILEAKESPFVERVVEPFLATDRHQAILITKTRAV